MSGRRRPGPSVTIRIVAPSGAATELSLDLLPDAVLTSSMCEALGRECYRLAGEITLAGQGGPG